MTVHCVWTFVHFNVSLTAATQWGFHFSDKILSRRARFFSTSLLHSTTNLLHLALFKVFFPKNKDRVSVALNWNYSFGYWKLFQLANSFLSHKGAKSAGCDMENTKFSLMTKLSLLLRKHGFKLCIPKIIHISMRNRACSLFLLTFLFPLIGLQKLNKRKNAEGGVHSKRLTKCILVQFKVM